MSRIIMLIPTEADVGLMQISSGLSQAMQNKGGNFCFFSPSRQNNQVNPNFSIIASLSTEHIESQLIANKQDVLMEEIVAKVIECGSNKDVVLVEGASLACQYARFFNAQVAKVLNADIIFVSSTRGEDAAAVNKRIDLCRLDFGGNENQHIRGVILDNAMSGIHLPLIAVCTNPFDNAEFVKSVNDQWLASLLVNNKERLLSPPAFRYQLTELARKAKKTVVLPEGDEPRTVKAAAICAERGIAKCVLLGDPSVIQQVAKQQQVELGAGIEIIDPQTIRENYVARLVELRKNKGMTEELARQQLMDNVVLGTMMLERNEVDGLVSGAVHTTANTIRPPLQIIKTDPGSTLVSSVFFMLLPDQVYIYGDCAINPNPSASELCDIAIQSADTAIAFGIEPRVAMLSYSTVNSGVGPDVDRVKEATSLVKAKRPDIVIDGPLQYDAAVMADVAKSKAPDSPVAGKANVFIFPNLSAGNIGYKAVQRAANIVSIGPMLQGMRKPVNDLSRGALVDDIVYTIALTAIQATQSV